MWIDYRTKNVNGMQRKAFVIIHTHSGDVTTMEMPFVEALLFASTYFDISRDSDKRLVEVAYKGDVIAMFKNAHEDY